MKRRLVAAASLGAVVVLGGPVVLAQAPAPGQSNRIVLIDLERVMIRSAAGTAAREQLEREKASMQREIDVRRQEVEKLVEELEKKGPLMTDEARRERRDAIERKRRDAARLHDDLQRDLARKGQLIERQVLQDVVGVVERVGKERKYYMIVDRRRAGVVYATPEAEITDEVIKAYDQQNASKGKK